MKHAFLAFAMLLLAGATSIAQTLTYSNLTCTDVYVVFYADNGTSGCAGPVAQSKPFFIQAGNSGSIAFSGTTPSPATFAWNGAAPTGPGFNFTYAEVYNACFATMPPNPINACSVHDDGVVVNNPNCTSPSTDQFSIPLGNSCGEHTLDECSPCPFPRVMTVDFTIPTPGDWDISIF